MERPNITEERLDELLLQAAKVDSVITIMNADFEEHEVYVIIATIFTNLVNNHALKDSSDNTFQDNEADKNLIYFRDLLIKKANSLAAKEKNG